MAVDTIMWRGIKSSCDVIYVGTLFFFFCYRTWWKLDKISILVETTIKQSIKNWSHAIKIFLKFTTTAAATKTAYIISKQLVILFAIYWFQIILRIFRSFVIKIFMSNETLQFKLDANLIHLMAQITF